MKHTYRGYKKYRLFLIGLFLLVVSPTLAQYEIPPVPELSEQKAVFQLDSLDVLSETQEVSLNNKLVRYADSTSTQIVIAIIKTTKGEDISLLGARWGEQWGVGQEGKDNGIMILLAHADRTIDINTGYGIETQLTDRIAEQIINRVIVPEFKNGYFYSGLDKGTNAIFEALNGTFKADNTITKTETEPVAPSGFWIMYVIIGVCLLFFLLPIILAIMGVKFSSGSGSTVYSNMGSTNSYSSGSYSSGSSYSSSSYSSSSSSSSSYSGGYGGGSFGGGGASGSW